MDKDYSKREHDAMVKTLEEKIDLYHTETMGRIEELKTKVDKTNGSVGNLKAWRTGLGMCLALVAFIVIPLMIYAFQLQIMNVKQDVLIQIHNENRPTQTNSQN